MICKGNEGLVTTWVPIEIIKEKQNTTLNGYWSCDYKHIINEGCKTNESTYFIVILMIRQNGTMDILGSGIEEKASPVNQSQNYQVNKSCCIRTFE
jgi:hypothetical protein